ncbi:hypothetical protein [Mycobacterium malmoense]|uniref:DNA-binding protein n=2 Tax=Mycobacterium malmoense TaxID=1780 RepID=A0ABX3SRU5_MYCMA|nr:hypothetical protein [Mycobacterium malmoense]ORA82091.1 hypothetical protein BST29_12935 [Mycobacterium malmoense]
MPFSKPIDPYGDDYVSVEECAKRMNITTEQVFELVSSHALRAYRWGGWGDIVVQPAILSGAPSTRPGAGEPTGEVKKRPRRMARS